MISSKYYITLLSIIHFLLVPGVETNPQTPHTVVNVHNTVDMLRSGINYPLYGINYACKLATCWSKHSLISKAFDHPQYTIVWMNHACKLDEAQTVNFRIHKWVEFPLLFIFRIILIVYHKIIYWKKYILTTNTSLDVSSAHKFSFELDLSCDNFVGVYMNIHRSILGV